MPTLNDLKQILTSELGFALHHINDGAEQPAIILEFSNGKGIKAEVEGIEEYAQFLVTTDVGNCYAAFFHPGTTLSDAEANRYKALAILMPGGPAAYCVVQVGDVLRIYLIENGDELHHAPENYDSIRDAEDMVQELKKNPELVERRKQWAEKTLRTENSLSRFVQILEGCWQDIWDIENQRNDWIFDEFSRLLFIKMNEDSKPNGRFTSASLTSHCRENEHMGEKAAQNFINGLFDELKGRFNGEKSDRTSEDDLLFKPNERIESSSTTIQKVIKRLEKINLRDTEGDVLGRAFEKMLSDTFKGRDLGQFFTPREIVKFMLDLARPDADSPVLNLEKEERFLDACAGSGGFLIYVYANFYNHLLSKNGNPEKRKQLLRRLGQDTIFACEIEPKAARLGKLNLIIHAINSDNTRWVHQNYYYNREFGGLNPEIVIPVDFGEGRKQQRLGPDMFDLIMTNPSFGRAVKRSEILLNYEFGYEIKTFKTKAPEKKPKNSQDSEVLFIEHYLRMLKPGGKLLIVLPDGVLSNSSAKPVRDYIRQQALIKAVISLPTETFASTGTNIPTNVVYLQRKRPGEIQGDIFMARADYVGRRANGDRMLEDDLPFILEKFREWQSGTLQHSEEVA